LQVYSEKEPEVVMNGIGFNMGNHAERLSSGLGFDLCYVIQENHWKGHISLQLGAKDLKIH
jgi:single-stranded-DNA-specific exonuclease